MRPSDRVWMAAERRDWTGQWFYGWTEWEYCMYWTLTLFTESSWVGLEGWKATRCFQCQRCAAGPPYWLRNNFTQHGEYTKHTYQWDRLQSWGTEGGGRSTCWFFHALNRQQMLKCRQVSKNLQKWKTETKGDSGIRSSSSSEHELGLMLQLHSGALWQAV